MSEYPPAPVTFQLPGGETLSAELPDDNDFTLGSGPDNDIVLDHPSLEPNHAVVHYHQGALRVEDISAETPFTRTLQPGQSVFVGQINVTHGTPEVHAPVTVPTGRDDNVDLQNRLEHMAARERTRNAVNTVLFLIVLAAIAYGAGFLARHIQG